MLVVLVQPKSFHTWEALNLAYLGATLKSCGADVLFYSQFFDSDNVIIAAARRADVVGFSCTSPQMKAALELAKECKTTANTIVFGGVHPSALPHELIMHQQVDAYVVGEGEEAILDVVFHGARGIIKRNPILDLDALPFPDRHLIKQERNIQVAYSDTGKRIASIMGSRGCPFSCTFCASSAVWGRRVRFRSAANILAELNQVVADWNIDFIKFSDDTFGLNKTLLRQFCHQKQASGNQTPWGCNVRADTIDSHTLEDMRTANCTEVWMGVESGSPAILKEMGKGETLNQIREAFALTRSFGLYRRAYVLLGYPGEDKRTIADTETLIDEIKPDAVGFTLLAPYPGNQHYNPACHGDVDWSIVDEYENRLVSTKALTNEQLHAEQKRLVAKYQATAVSRQKVVAT